MIQQQLTGTGIALVTPFTDNFEVDTASLEKLVHYVIEGGVDYLVVLGTTGESVTLSKQEKELVKKTISKANNGRVPMVLGVASNNTSTVVEELKNTSFEEYCAILSVSPYYNKPSQEGIYQHFKKVAENSPLPIILYNVPSRTGANMTTETTFRLAKDFDNIIGVKEATSDFFQVMELVKGKPKDFLVLSGDDLLALPATLLGGEGVISVMGQGLPREFSKMIHLALENNSKDAADLHLKFMEITSLIFKEGNPTGIKALLKSLGIISSAKVRLPLVEATPSLVKEMESALTCFV